MVAFGLGMQAATPVAGVALVNGTPAIITWTTPNDGLQHRVAVFGEVNVGSTETGGAIRLAYTDPAGNAHNVTLTAGGSGAGLASFGSGNLVCVQANTAVTVSQSSALTGGAATVFAEIWGS